MIKPEDIGGYSPDPNICKFPCGSLFAEEGMKIYQLIRTHKPKTLIEVGAFVGCSTSYICCAIRDNGFGDFISIDNGQMAGTNELWSMLPKELDEFVTKKITNALEYQARVNFLFEDGAHTTGTTETVLKNIKADLVVVHDYCHPTCQETVAREFDRIFGKPDEIFGGHPSNCGLAIKYVNNQPS